MDMHCFQGMRTIDSLPRKGEEHSLGCNGDSLDNVTDFCIKKRVSPSHRVILGSASGVVFGVYLEDAAVEPPTFLFGFEVSAR
jgi:hypothetical protein